MVHVEPSCPSVGPGLFPFVEDIQVPLCIPYVEVLDPSVDVVQSDFYMIPLVEHYGNGIFSEHELSSTARQGIEIDVGFRIAHQTELLVHPEEIRTGDGFLGLTDFKIAVVKTMWTGMLQKVVTAFDGTLDDTPCIQVPAQTYTGGFLAGCDARSMVAQ